MTAGRRAVTALVLAGGAASRMGGSKAERRLSGATLLERSLRLADAVADEVLLLPGARNLPEAAGRRCVADWLVPEPLTSPSTPGPLAALGAGLQAARNPWCLLLPCDMPWMSAAVARLLADRASISEHEIVAVRSSGGWEPFAALYRSELAGRVRRQLDAGGRSLHALIESSATLPVEADELRALDPRLRCLHNLNTHAELAAAELLECAR